MKKVVALFLISALLLTASLPAFAETTVTQQTYGVLYEKFTDAEDIDPSAAADVAKAVEAGILKGNASGSLEPKKSTTGAEFITVMLRVLNISSDSAATTAVGNVPDWAVKDANKAVELGLVEKDSKVVTESTKPLTRVDAAVMIAKMLGLDPVKGNVPFKDTKGYGDDVNGYLLALYQKGLFVGVGNGIFGGDYVLTREQIAIVVARILANQ